MMWKEKIVAEEPYGIGNDLMHFHYTGEEIVRCRDCEHYMDVTESCRHFRAELYDDSLGDTATWFFAVEPDGFCSWGVKKRG